MSERRIIDIYDLLTAYCDVLKRASKRGVKSFCKCDATNGSSNCPVHRSGE